MVAWKQPLDISTSGEITDNDEIGVNHPHPRGEITGSIGVNNPHPRGEKPLLTSTSTSISTSTSTSKNGSQSSPEEEEIETELEDNGSVEATIRFIY